MEKRSKKRTMIPVKDCRPRTPVGKPIDGYALLDYVACVIEDWRRQKQPTELIYDDVEEMIDDMPELPHHDGFATWVLVGNKPRCSHCDHEALFGTEGVVVHYMLTPVCPFCGKNMGLKVDVDGTKFFCEE